MPRGRPSKYKPEYAEQVYRLCLLGATDEAIADFFGISTPTIYEWKKHHPEFSSALKAGKDEADAKVAQSLYHRAIGYSHPEDKIFQYEGQPVIVPTTKHYPPDPTSMIFWLKNRQREHWRDKVDTEITGKDGGPVQVTSIKLVAPETDGDD
jgi:hypothetical protein